jgi:hypothetical protein
VGRRDVQGFAASGDRAGSATVPPRRLSVAATTSGMEPTSLKVPVFADGGFS